MIEEVPLDLFGRGLRFSNTQRKAGIRHSHNNGSALQAVEESADCLTDC